MRASTINPDGSYTVEEHLEENGERLRKETLYIANGREEVTDRYDQFGRMDAQTHWRGGTTTYVYDDNDQVLSVTVPPPSTAESEQKTSYQYDTRGRVIKETHPDLNEVDYLYTDNYPGMWMCSVLPMQAPRSQSTTFRPLAKESTFPRAQFSEFKCGPI